MNEGITAATWPAQYLMHGYYSSQLCSLQAAANKSCPVKKACHP
jgi:hypothetical protein